jgi:hypothetical protein
MEQKQTAFIALPLEEAIIGTELSGMIVFSENEIKKKLEGLNGQSKNFRVAELQLPIHGCKKHGEGYLIPRGISAKVRKCYPVNEFIHVH